jgi:polar amino acid transport system permease protein
MVSVPQVNMDEGRATETGDRGPVVRAVPVRHPGRWVVVSVVLVLLAMLTHALITNTAFQWDVVGRYLTAPTVLAGLRTTLELTLIALVGGFLLGVVLALMRQSGNWVLSSLSWGYTWLFRSVPMLVQLLFWYNIPLLYPRLSLGIPFGWAFGSFSTKNAIGAMTAAVIGLTLHEAAQAGEIVRAGILSVGRGQREAAAALGLTRGRILLKIVLPQAMRVILPPMGNQTISMLKGTAIVSIIAVRDLLFATQEIYDANYLVIPLLLVATIWYVVVTSILGVAQYYVERHYSRGTAGSLAPTPPARARRWLSVHVFGRRIGAEGGHR